MYTITRMNTRQIAIKKKITEVFNLRTLRLLFAFRYASVTFCLSVFITKNKAKTAKSKLNKRKKVTTAMAR